jgi:hypothetical protein
MNKQAKSNARRPGRRKGSTTLPRDFRQDIWIEVEAVREQIELRGARRPPVTQACDVIARRGGLIWIVGGNIDAVTAAMVSERKAPFSRWRRFKFGSRNTRHIVVDEAGRIIVSHLLQNAATLRSRYVEANRLVRESSAVREAWTNMLCDRLGRPRRPLSHGRFCR